MAWTPSQPSRTPRGYRGALCQRVRPGSDGALQPTPGPGLKGGHARLSERGSAWGEEQREVPRGSVRSPHQQCSDRLSGCPGRDLQKVLFLSEQTVPHLVRAWSCARDRFTSAASLSHALKLVRKSSLTPTIFFLNLFICLRGRDTDRKGEKELQSAGLLPQWPQQPGLGQADARSFFQVSHAGTRAQAVGPSAAAFPGISGELDRMWSSQVLKWHPYWMPALQSAA